MTGEPNELKGLNLDELTWYIYSHYPGLLTEEEAAAHRVRTCTIKTQVPDREFDTEYYETLLKVPDVRTRFPELMARIGKEGFAALMSTAANRVVRDHPDKVFLNHCAQCGGLCRTPWVRRCFKCGHRWPPGRTTVIGPK